MNKIFNAAKIFVTVIFLCGIIFIGGKASAEIRIATLDDDEVQVVEDMGEIEVIDEKAMEIFRETVIQTSKFDNRAFHQDIFFVVPRFTGELDFLGAVEKDSLKATGELEFWAVDDNGKDTHTEYPFYLVQDSKNMVLYFKDDKKWKKMTSPVAAKNFVDMVATPNSQELEKMMAFVKDVNVLYENDKYRTLLVKLDCGKFIDEIKAEMAKDPEVQKQADNPMANSFLNIMEQGFRSADVWYTWRVNKTTWQTDTMSFNLSGLVQNIASAALNDPSTESLPAELREVFETLAFYSEFKAYTTYLNPAAKSKLEVPKNVLKAKEVESFSDDSKSKKK